MSPEKIAELKNRPIDLSDIPEVTSEQLKDFYSRNKKGRISEMYPQNAAFLIIKILNQVQDDSPTVY